MSTKSLQMPTIIGFKELRENAGKYISAVEKGRSFTVVRRSKPIFNITPVDEWGDEGVWEKIIDFSDKNGRGIRAEDFAKMLRRSILYGQKRKVSK